MPTSRQQLQQWFEQGLERDSATYMLVMCDTFDWEDYPVYCSTQEEVRAYINRAKTNMGKPMEIYDLTKPAPPQLQAHRTWAFTP